MLIFLDYRYKIVKVKLNLYIFSKGIHFLEWIVMYGCNPLPHLIFFIEVGFPFG